MEFIWMLLRVLMFLTLIPMMIFDTIGIIYIVASIVEKM